MASPDSYSQGISDFFQYSNINGNSENFGGYDSFKDNDNYQIFQSTNEKSFSNDIPIIESLKIEQKEKNNLSSDNETKNIINNRNLNKNNCKNLEFIGKKTKKKNPKFISENSQEIAIFNNGTFDGYSKRMINEASDKNFKKILKNKNSNGEIIDKKRRFRTDEIMNKFLGRFFKETIYKINEKLKFAKSKKFFSKLPQYYIKKIKTMILAAKKEKKIAEKDLTLEKIFSIDFCGKDKIFVNNNNTIYYLNEEKNKAICENSNYSIFKDIKLSELFNLYFNSKEFGKEILILKEEEQEDDYIKEYIYKGKKFFDPFFQLTDF